MLSSSIAMIAVASTRLSPSAGCSRAHLAWCVLGELYDPASLLEAADRMGLEGIVSKQTAQPYKSGRNRGWIKVKCHAWRAINADRGELFKK